MKKWIVRLGLVPLLLLPLLASAESPRQLVFSHVVGPDTPKGKMATMFQSIVEQKLGGRYQVVVHPNSTLMNDVEVIDAVAAGEVHFAAPSLSKFAGYTSRLKLFSLPFLFPDMAAVDRFQQSEAGRGLLTSMQDSNILGLGYLHNGLKQLTADRPFREPQDLAGLRFRIMDSPVLRAQFEQIGAEPVPLAFADVYDALASGMIQGQENTWSNIYSKNFQHHQPYLMESNHGVLDYLLITNNAFWQGLPDEDRRMLSYAMDIALRYGNSVATAKSRNDHQDLKRMREVTVYRPSEAELDTWRRAMQPVWAEFEEAIGRHLIDAALAASKPSAGER
ncbi:DctP family TRAP transporter solute-binding subunit [Marinobacter sp. CA1]|uniref:DctP family TRAP transporter solute-binding subunit n=1 Tax=Marinobacter sp. CA1 TaxID=2817656 RepID=UPI001D097EEE|nr:DctP family TRAP transporter solute-binding subunit [Marinobacter sp. CA1]